MLRSIEHLTIGMGGISLAELLLVLSLSQPLSAFLSLSQSLLLSTSLSLFQPETMIGSWRVRLFDCCKSSSCERV